MCALALCGIAPPRRFRFAVLVALHARPHSAVSAHTIGYRLGTCLCRRSASTAICFVCSTRTHRACSTLPAKRMTRRA